MSLLRTASQFFQSGALIAAFLNCGHAPAIAQGTESTTQGKTDSHSDSGADSPTPADIQRWIEQLGHDAYSLRQAAAEQLLDAGMLARNPLVSVADGPDPETRAAARRLVALIDRTEFERRLEEFANDTDGSKGLTLPGWDRYRELAGDDTTARALFVEMQREEGPLLADVFGVSSESALKTWEERLIRLVQWQVMNDRRGTRSSLGSAAAMLFMGTLPELSGSPRGATWVEQLVQRPPIRETLQTGTYRDPLRRLLAGWILNGPSENEALFGRRLYLASVYELKEAIPIALSVALGEAKYANFQPMTRAAAILIIGHLGEPRHIDQLEPLLEDASVCVPRVSNAPGQALSNVQIRDVALVVLITLSDQRPADYGYLHARIQSQRFYQLHTLYFENDAQRTEAIAKWRQWRAAQIEAQGD